MKAMLDILSVQVLPNSVETGASYRIVADVRPIVPVLATKDGKLLTTKNRNPIQVKGEGLWRNSMKV